MFYLLMGYAFFLPISHVIIDKLLIFIVLLFFMSSNLKEKFLYGLKNKVVLAFVLFFSMHVIWMVGSDNLDIARFELKDSMVLLYPLLFISLIRKKDVEKLFLTLIISLFISSIWSYLIFFHIYDSPVRICFEAVPFLYKGDYGFFLITLLMYSLYRLISMPLTTRYKYFLLIFFLLGSVNIFIIGSKTSYFAYIIGISSVVLMKSDFLSFKKVILFFLGIISIYFVAYYTIDNFHQRMDLTYESSKEAIEEKDFNTSAGARYGMVLYSIPVIKENWLFGVGTGDHAVEVRNRIVADYRAKIAAGHTEATEQYKELIRSMFIGKSSHLHNTYLQVLVQFGIIGFLVFMNIFYQIYRSETSQEYKALQKSLIIVYFFISFGGADFMFHSLGKFFVFVLMLTIANYHDKSQKDEALSA